MSSVSNSYTSDDVNSIFYQNPYVKMGQERAAKIGSKPLTFGAPAVKYTPEQLSLSFSNSTPYTFTKPPGLNKYSNSINLSQGFTCNAGSNYKFTVSGKSVDVTEPDSAMTGTTMHKKRVAAGLNLLIRKANKQKLSSDFDKQFEDYTPYILEGLQKAGIDITKPFIVNGSKFMVDKESKIHQIT